jgi:hypothetical protein
METGLESLLRYGPVAINLGLRGFAESLFRQGAQVVHVDWTPPADIDDETAAILDKLL